MQDIHGIRPPIQVGLDPVVFKIMWMVLAGILVFAVLFFLIRKWFKKRKLPTDLTALPEPLAPYDAAIKALDLLLQREMNDPRLFYFDLTAVLRKYIGCSFHINAVEMTSQEFVRGINPLALPTVVKKEISGFLSLSDPFKYAGIAAQKDQVRKDLLFIRELIEKIEKELAEKRTAEEGVQ